MQVSKEQIAKLLGDVDVMWDLSIVTKGVASEANAAGLVIVFVRGDESVEIEGATFALRSVHGGDGIFFDKDGLLPMSEDAMESESAACSYVARRARAKGVRVIYKPEGLPHIWLIKTSVPHATFDMTENGEPYCRGVVFALADLDAAEVLA